MLNLLGCLDRPTSGRYLLGDADVSQMDDDSLSAVRGARLGFIFQSYHLIQQLSVLENIEIPLYYQGRPEAESREMAKGLAERVMREASTPTERFGRAMMHVVGRPPTAEELKILVTAFDRSRERGVGELDAYAMVCSTILNLDEAVTQQ